MANVYKGEKVVHTGVFYTEDGSNATGSSATAGVGPDGTGIAVAAEDLDKAKGYVAHPKGQFYTDQAYITPWASLAEI